MTLDDSGLQLQVKTFKESNWCASVKEDCEIMKKIWLIVLLHWELAWTRKSWATVYNAVAGIIHVTLLNNLPISLPCKTKKLTSRFSMFKLKSTNSNSKKAKAIYFFPIKICKKSQKVTNITLMSARRTCSCSVNSDRPGESSSNPRILTNIRISGESGSFNISLQIFTAKLSWIVNSYTNRTCLGSNARYLSEEYTEFSFRFPA